MKSFGDMMKQAQKMQKQMGELQEKLAGERYAADRGDASTARHGELHRLPGGEFERPHLLEADLPARRLDGGPRGRSLFARDPRHTLELLRTEPAAAETRRPYQHHLVVDEGLALELQRQRHATHDRKLNLVRADEIDRARRGGQAEVQLYHGVSLVEACDELGQEVRAGNARCRERERSDVRVAARGQGAAGIREQRFRAEHVVRKDVARRSQGRAAPIANDELGSELGLEGSDVLRDRRLADVQALGGPREGALTGNCRESSQSRLEVHHLRLYARLGTCI